MDPIQLGRMTHAPEKLDELPPRRLNAEIRELFGQYADEVPGARRMGSDSIRARILALGSAWDAQSPDCAAERDSPGDGVLLVPHKPPLQRWALMRGCTTPSYSPESNGMAEALVKTFRRDDVWSADLSSALRVI